MRCPNCETENREGAKFCDECGYPLAGSAARASYVPADQPQGEEPGSLEGAADLAPRPVEGLPDSALEPKTMAIPLEALRGDDAGVGNAFEEQPALFDLEGGDGADPEGFAAEPETELGEGAPALDSAEDAGFDLDAALEAGSEPMGPAQELEAEPEGGTRLADAPVADGPSYEMSAWPADTTLKMPKLETEPPERAREFLASSTKKKDRRKLVRNIVIVLLAIAAAAAVAFGTYAAGVWGGKTIPDVTGMTEADAAKVLQEQGFEVRPLQVKSDDTEGLVLLMDPGAGTRAPDGSEVVIHVATARLIPDVVGVASEDALAQLAELGYGNVVVETQKSNDAEDVVLSIEPEPGTRVKSTVEVKVLVSEAYRVPDIGGLDLEEAIAAVEEAGLTPQTAYINTTDVPDGELTGTDPEAGTKMNEGDVVTIGIARARSLYLERLTEDLLASGNSVTIDGYTYDIVGLNWTEFQGDDTVAFSATARAKITFFGETLYTSSTQNIQGVVEWSPEDEVLAIY